MSRWQAAAVVVIGWWAIPIGGLVVFLVRDAIRTRQARRDVADLRARRAARDAMARAVTARYVTDEFDRIARTIHHPSMTAEDPR